MPRSTRQPAATRPRPWRNYSRPWRRSDELPTSVLGRAAPHGETLRSRPPAGPRGPGAPETAAREPGHPEPRGPRRGAALHPAFTDELRNRHGPLSARLLHDEIQSEVHGRTRGPPDRRADPSGSGRVHRPRGLAPPVRTPGGARDDRGHGRRHVAARRGGSRRTHGSPPGGGGPGAGPVGVRKALEPFLPVPQVHLNGRGYHLDYDRPKSIGKVRAWYGNFALLVRAYAYILRMGGNGLREVSERAVLNANYVRHRLSGALDVPFGGLRKHEFVASASKLAAKGVRTVDIAKRLMDFGYHPPTVYFPHLVEEALMIEPTETETKETLDAFVDALTEIVGEDPEILHSAPHNTAVRRVDEVRAAREPILSARMAKARKNASL